MRQDRRRSKRVTVQEAVSITLGKAGGIVTAVSDVSSGGPLLYCDRLISPRSEVGLVIVLPLEVTHGISRSGVVFR